MPFAFLDTSAFLKLYIPEKGSNWLQIFIASQRPVVSELVFYECATAFRRCYIEGVYTQAQALAIHTRIRGERAIYEVVGLGNELQLDRLITLTFNLAPALRIRALDAIHLSAASLSQDLANSLTPPEPFIFVSSDRQLLQVAQAQGFSTENPEDHP